MIEEPIENNEQTPPRELIDQMFENYFLDYASYVILERAVPAGEDGLKPVQRRFLHALKEIDCNACSAVNPYAIAVPA